MSTIAFAVLLAVSGTTTRATPVPDCQGLEAKQAAAYQKLLTSQHPYDCCDENISSCLKTHPQCALAKRLATDICQRLKNKQTNTEIQRALARRAHTVMGFGKPLIFERDDDNIAGDGLANVEVVVYACARCPFCSKLVPALYSEVTQGRLRGKVKLMLHPFPLKSHPHSVDAALAVLAAAQQKKLWSYTLLLYQRFDDFDIAKLDSWSQEMGLDAKLFAATRKDPKTRALLVASKQEGVRNKVQATPSLLINGRPYDHDLDIDVLVDVLDEMSQRSLNAASNSGP